MANRIDPICGMVGTIERDGHWFCSERCAEQFKAQSTQGCAVVHKSWKQDKVLWSAVLLGGVYFGGFLIPAVRSVSHALAEYIGLVGAPVLLGLVIGGLINHYVPKEYISKILASNDKRTIFSAAGLGVLASACSHGVIVLSMELYRKGASIASVVTFLLASPWASLPVTFLLIRLMGWRGVVVIVAAVIVSIATGFLFRTLSQRRLVESNPHTVIVSEGFSIREDFARRWRQRQWTLASLREDLVGIAQGTWSLSQMVIWWVSIGLVLSSLIAGWAPADFMQRHFGPTLMGLLATLGFATVMEVCSEGTAPLAYELYRQTSALGNAFVFLMAGVITDYTELMLLWKNVGRRTALWVVGTTLPQVLILGFLLNLFIR